MNQFVRKYYEHQIDSSESKGCAITRQVVIIGGGLVGLTMALDLAKRNIAVLILDDDNTVSVGGRAICHARKTMEIWDRLDIAADIFAKGVTWGKGKIFFQKDLIYEFTMENDNDYFPPFINLQQYYVEEALVNKINENKLIDLRWNSKLTAIEQQENGVLLHVDGPISNYTIFTDWLIAADGAHSTIRNSLGLECRGISFNDRFLNTSVRLSSGREAERLFWFNPPSHPGGTVLMHQQADNLWRIDFEINADEKEIATDIAHAAVRVAGLVGNDEELEIEWTSTYAVQCKTLEQYRYNRIIFVGDSAHQVSPYGARGGNAGVQDVENLGWKLQLVLAGKSPIELLDTYSEERVAAAYDNVKQSSQSTEFITPHSYGSRLLRDTVLRLAPHSQLAQKAINTGRLSEPAIYTTSTLNTKDEDIWEGSLQLGSSIPSFSITTFNGTVALHHILGEQFVGLHIEPRDETDIRKTVEESDLNIKIITLPFNKQVQALLGALPNTLLLLRPDGHLCARWMHPTKDKLIQALKKSQGL